MKTATPPKGVTARCVSRRITRSPESRAVISRGTSLSEMFASTPLYRKHLRAKYSSASEFRLKRRMLRYRVLERPRVWRRVVRVKEWLPPRAFQQFYGYAAEFPMCPVDELTPTLCVGHPHDRRTAVRHDTEAVFTLSQRLLHPFPLRDIFHVGHEIQRAAGAVPHQREPATRPHNTS